MRRSLWLILTALIAVVGWGVADEPERPAVMTPEISVRLTTAESDCIVGGEAGCLEVAAGSYGGCVEKNFDPEQPETAVAFVNCGAVGLWTGIVCVANWIWGLFF